MSSNNVSPQFHVKHDNFSETVKQSKTSFYSPPADWKYLSGLYQKQKCNQSETKHPTSGAMTEPRHNNTNHVPSTYEENLIMGSNINIWTVPIPAWKKA